MIEKNIRVEIKDREWLEYKFALDPLGRFVQNVEFKAQGCIDLLHAVEKAAREFKGKALETLEWSDVHTHWGQMICEALSRLKGTYELPYKDPEICHCRNIPTSVVEQAIVLGAQTPEKVRAWTNASSSCGTCRSDVEALIKFRVAHKACKM